jgi:hypothetical protein
MGLNPICFDPQHRNVVRSTARTNRAWFRVIGFRVVGLRVVGLRVVGLRVVGLRVED